jgi:hypothetical protein
MVCGVPLFIATAISVMLWLVNLAFLVILLSARCGAQLLC